jgi:Transcription factor WhiB
VKWYLEAACRRSDPEVWCVDNKTGAPTTKEDKSIADAAIKICRECPVRSQCLTEGFRLDDKYGLQWAIYGGRLPSERRNMRRGPRPKREPNRPLAA